MRLILIIGALALLSACGGSSGPSSTRVLHLRTGDFTEAQLLAQLRADGLSGCADLKGLDAAAVRDMNDARFSKEPDKSRIIQASNPADDLRQAQLQIDECARIK